MLATCLSDLNELRWQIEETSKITTKPAASCLLEPVNIPLYRVTKKCFRQKFWNFIKKLFSLKNFYNHRLCWNCPTTIAGHAFNRRIIFWNTCCVCWYFRLCCVSVLQFRFSIRLVWLACWGTHYFSSMPKKEVRWSQIGTSYWPLALRYDPIFKKFN